MYCLPKLCRYSNPYGMGLEFPYLIFLRFSFFCFVNSFTSVRVFKILDLLCLDSSCLIYLRTTCKQFYLNCLSRVSWEIHGWKWSFRIQPVGHYMYNMNMMWFQWDITLIANKMSRTVVQILTFAQVSGWHFSSPDSRRVMKSFRSTSNNLWGLWRFLWDLPAARYLRCLIPCIHLVVTSWPFSKLVMLVDRKGLSHYT